MRRHKSRYNLKEIEERLDIKRGRLREWSKNKYIRGVEGEYRGRKIEQSTLIDAYQIALFRYLVEECKILRDEAGLYVNQWRDLIDSQGFTSKLLNQIEQGSEHRSIIWRSSNSFVAFIRKIDGSLMVLFDRDKIEEAQKELNWKMMLSVNIYKIGHEVDDLLNE